MGKVLEGRIWKLGNDIDTDIIIPTQFLALKNVVEMKKYAFYPLRPELPALIQKGDIIVVGKNFGCGSSREQAPEILVNLGIACVIAKSYARIFFRNSLNNGLFLFENGEFPDLCNEGDLMAVDLEAHQIIYGKQKFPIAPIPSELLAMVEAGGLVPFMKKRNLR